MNPFLPKPTWEPAVLVSDQAGLQAAINTAATTGANARIELTSHIILEDNALNVPAGATIFLASRPGGHYTIDAGNTYFGVMNVQTDPQTDTTVYFGDIDVTGGTGFPMGGAVHSEGGGNALIALEGGNFMDNTSTNGGAIGLTKGAVGLFGGAFSENHAYGNGGAIYVAEGYGDGGPAFIMNEDADTGPSTVTLNTAGQSGGAIYIENTGEAVIEDGRIFKNLCEINGGGIFAQAFNMSGGRITDNTAHVQGGGIFLNGAGTIGGDSLIDGNNSHSGGGGIFMNTATNATLTITDNVKITNNTTDGGFPNGGGGIYVAHSNLENLTVTAEVEFTGNSSFSGTSVAQRRQEDDEIYENHIFPESWSDNLSQGYNNYDISYDESGPSPPCPAIVGITMTKNARGATLEGGEFKFEISGMGIETINATNNAHGLIVFPALTFTEAGTFYLTAKETDGLQDWDLDETTFPITVVVACVGSAYQASVSYPGTSGVPCFTNTHHDAGCGMFEFPEIIFDAPGVYEYTLKEISVSGGGWTTDPKTINVIVTVTDDGHGNLVASARYPDGYPSFTNTYNAVPARIIISGCKVAVGAPLPSGKFSFGLYNSKGELINVTTNGPAEETEIVS